MVPFRELVEFAIGGGWGSESSTEEATEVLVIRGTDFKAAASADVMALPRRFEKLTKLPKRILAAGDLVLEISGGSRASGQATGRSLLVTEALVRAGAGTPLIPASFCRLVRTKDDLVDPRYALALLHEMRRSGRAFEYQNDSTGISNFQFEDFLDREIVALPPLNEQRAIAEVLGALDDKIESNRRLSNQSAAFFNLVAEERLLQARSSGAKSMTLDSIAKNVKLKSEDITRPYIGLDLMPQGSTVLTAWLAEDGPATSLDFEAGDVLFGKLRPYFKKVGVAPIAGRCSSEILVVRPEDPEDYGQVVAVMSSQSFIDHCNAVSTGTKMPRSEWKLANQFQTPTLGRDTKLELTSLARSSYALVTRLTLESQTLSAIRDALLPRLISGRLRVEGFGEQAKAA